MRKSKVGIQDVKCWCGDWSFRQGASRSKGAGRENVLGKYSTGVVIESQDSEAVCLLGEQKWGKARKIRDGKGEETGG